MFKNCFIRKHGFKNHASFLYNKIIIKVKINLEMFYGRKKWIW